eukprot:589125-Amphidinium_carterae.1
MQWQCILHFRGDWSKLADVWKSELAIEGTLMQQHEGGVPEGRIVQNGFVLRATPYGVILWMLAKERVGDRTYLCLNSRPEQQHFRLTSHTSPMCLNGGARRWRY